MSGTKATAAASTVAVVGGELAAKSRASDLERKVEEIFTVLREPVYRYLTGLLGSRDDAEELTQEAFLALYGHLKKGKPVANCRAWVFRVAHNLAVNHQKRPALIEPMDDAALERFWKSKGDPALNGEQLLLTKERYAKLSRALSLLSAQERNCLNLRAEGLRFSEISEVLGIRISTVETFVDRGIKKIAKEING
jgi:RNA polymerase sigma-70 factor (ECF subfamily)